VVREFPGEPPVSGSVDVVIVTKDRPGSISSLLDDLRRTSPGPGRVVVVDDSTAPIEWPARFPDLPIVLLRPSPRGFISRSKNLGVAQCTADYVAFIDDDNRIPVDLLARLAHDLDSHPKWGAVMPGVLYDQRPDLVWVYATPFRPDRWGFSLQGRNALRDPTLEHRVLATDALPNLSMLRASVLRRVGGFDERLPVNSSADLCQRVKRAGWEVWADTSVLTRHAVEPPGAPGYWAEHTVQNPERCRLEVADWFRFHRRWNGDRTFFALDASVHALGFMAPQLLASLVRREGRTIATLVAILRGWKEGLASGFPTFDAAAR
jgi:glycosyltransferase involved in cell wall biosynthesis